MPLPENIHVDILPAIGQPLAGGNLITLYWLNGTEYALVELGAEAEIRGPWGKYGQGVSTTHGDGEANTRAMAEAGSAIAIQALELSAFIPSALESHLLMHAKESGVITDLREDRLYWTSSQFSADNAYFMGFESGWQLSYDKNLERPVRLVRKIPILR